MIEVEAPRLVFCVPGRPVPKARARRGAGGHWYTPARSAAYADRVAACAWEARVRNHQGWSLDGRYRVLIVARLFGRYRMDADNLSKQTLDACQRILWANDRQVREITVRLEEAISRDDQALLVTVQEATGGAE